MRSAASGGGGPSGRRVESSPWLTCACSPERTLLRPLEAAVARARGESGGEDGIVIEETPRSERAWSYRAGRGKPPELAAGFWREPDR